MLTNRLCCLFLFFVQVHAVRLDQCRDKFANDPKNITYLQCVETCGGGVGEFKWSTFSQGFGAWLLPWFALIFQLPFGATDRIDNLASVLLAIGSPALAAYSLAVTRLNSRWLSHKFMGLNFANKEHIPLAVSALQHIPFRIVASGSLLPSLIVLPQNDRYWQVLGMAAKRTRQWSIPTAMNIVWVLVAFLLTILDSFVNFDHFITVPGDAGYSIATVWAFLLPLVIGWLHVGCQPDADHLRIALDDAHETAYMAITTGPVPATTRAIESSTRHVDHVNGDEKKTAPIFNYSRVFIWSGNAKHILRLCENAAFKAERKITVQRNGEWIDGCTQNRIGNEEEVIQYCMEEREPIQFPTPYSAWTLLSEPHAFLKTNANPDAFELNRFASNYEEEVFAEVPEKPMFATGVFERVVLATILALSLQWGTTGASILIHLFSPPKGMGCRALTFIVYGAAATAAFFLLLFSSIVSHLVCHQSARPKRLRVRILMYIATFTRWLGKLIAIMNGFGILTSCIMQFAGVYDNCFCSSTIFGGTPNGLVLFIEENIKGSEVYGYWRNYHGVWNECTLYFCDLCCHPNAIGVVFKLRFLWRRYVI